MTILFHSLENNPYNALNKVMGTTLLAGNHKPKTKMPDMIVDGKKTFILRTKHRISVLIRWEIVTYDPTRSAIMPRMTRARMPNAFMIDNWYFPITDFTP